MIVGGATRPDSIDATSRVVSRRGRRSYIRLFKRLIS